jgi:hypothetical protein
VSLFASPLFLLCEINNGECKVGYVTGVEREVLSLPGKELKTFHGHAFALRVEKGIGTKLAYRLFPCLLVHLLSL